MDEYRKIKRGTVKTVTITYPLNRVVERVWTEDEETGRESYQDIELRPALTITTTVTRIKDNYGNIRFYGKQGAFNGKQ